MKKLISLAAGLACAVALTATAQTDPVSKAIDNTQQNNRASVQSQQRVNQLDDQTRSMLERYRAATWQAQQMNVYAKQLDGLLTAQDAEKQSLQRQIAEMARVEQDLLPLMLRMLESLDKFVALDLPFLQDERKERVASLRRMMADPSVGIAEKYRRLLEAYQVEADYGRGLGVERLEVDGRAMDALRVGRTALYAVSADGADAVYWDATAKTWQPLQHKYVATLRKGFKLARETVAPDFIALPMPPPTGATP